jgi:septal ring factor EnvC (AmiA/AmiB activator)
MKSNKTLVFIVTIGLILIIAVAFSQNLQLKDDKQQTSLDSKVMILESKVTALETKVSALEVNIKILEEQISNPKTKVIPLNH